MKSEQRSVCIVIDGLNRLNRGLQPWLYVTEVAIQLKRRGHAVTILSRAGPHALSNLEGVPVKSLPSVRKYFWQRNPALEQAIGALNPQVVLWSIGLTSFLHQDFRPWHDRRQIGVFSSPIYSPREVLRPGLARLAANYPLSGVHVLGAFSPRWFLRSRAAGLGLDAYVTQTRTTGEALTSIVEGKPVMALLPGVDGAWLDCRSRTIPVRTRFNLSNDDFVVLYFGSPAPLRGLPVLVEALALARQQVGNLKLVVLNRRYKEDITGESQPIEQLVAAKGLGDAVRIVQGYSGLDHLAGIVRASDLVALPYELLPFDAPLSVLEAVAAQKPILTSRLASLPELAAQSRAFLAEPGDPLSVAQALLAAYQAHGASVPLGNAVRAWETVGAEWSELIQTL